MQNKLDTSTIRSLLFAFNVENPVDDEHQEIIASKNVNNPTELSSLFDIVLWPEFKDYLPSARQRCIDSLEYHLSINDSFSSIFNKITFYFDDEVHDYRCFMDTLLTCLKRYQINLNNSDEHLEKS